MSQSVSFRITRTAEDVAQTLNALSQRLVKLEQRLESLELEMRHQRSQSSPCRLMSCNVWMMWISCCSTARSC